MNIYVQNVHGVALILLCAHTFKNVGSSLTQIMAIDKVNENFIRDQFINYSKRTKRIYVNRHSMSCVFIILY